ncbi:hypothetical protein [Candidatus Viridilinea mediisalina]|uniref:Uncharacterized protein n=1 Tax=Candidatus Viridilinea mediisalina TaxID=2024553 RepID=A0A2A6RLB2_9CHLR|nr:hypothetical protein [Candidatus Viridilinea mediisalina]PDW03857.1 hypothetical protein CJ255_06810 [Candidatus Viridilinea mediisalina]
MSLLRDPKRLVAVLVAGVSGLIVLIDFIGGGPVFHAAAVVLVEWAAVMTALALLLGVFSVTGSHLSRVGRRKADWPYSLVLLLGMLIVIVAGIFFPLPGPAGLVLPATMAEEPIRVVFRTLYEPLAASLLALLAFFSLSAAMRALQRGSREALVIVVVAALVLITQLPPVAALPAVGPTVQWINEFVALAGARGLLIGAAIGAFVAGLRLLFGFDTPYLDR